MAWEDVPVYLPGRPGSGLANIEVDFDDGQPPAPGDPFPVGGGSGDRDPYRLRVGRTRINERVAQRVLVDTSNAEARRRLGVEVEIGEHLVREWPEEGYPDQLSRLLGSNLDTALPYVLATRRGEPLPAVSLGPRLESSASVAAIDGVVMGLLRLAQAGVVCRAVSPETLLWDGAALQFGYFGHAALKDTPRDPVSAAPAPWRAPDPPAGVTRVADPRDDVFSGALVLYWLLTGERPDAAWPSVADRVSQTLELQDDSVRKLLRGAFSRSAVDRIDARDLAQRLRGYGLPRPDVITAPHWDVTGDRSTQGLRAEFRQLMEAQAAFLANRPARPAPPRPTHRAEQLVDPLVQNLDIGSRYSSRLVTRQTAQIASIALLLLIAAVTVGLVLL